MASKRALSNDCLEPFNVFKTRLAVDWRRFGFIGASDKCACNAQASASGERPFIDAQTGWGPRTKVISAGGCGASVNGAPSGSKKDEAPWVAGNALARTTTRSHMVGTIRLLISGLRPQASPTF